MNWKTAWMLAGTALVLFVFIVVYERHTLPTGEGARPQPRLLNFQPNQVSGVQLRRTNQLVLDVRRTNQTWRMIYPLTYPVQSYTLEGLLGDLARLEPIKSLEPKEWKAGGGLAAFSLDLPRSTLVLHHGAGRAEIAFGDLTSVGGEVYVKTPDDDRIYTVDASWLDRLPSSIHTWRDPLLIQGAGLQWDRLEIRTPNRGFTIRFDPTNQVFYLSQPTPARADQAKVRELLEATMTGRVLEFVDDNPSTDLERYGLQTPSLEVTYGVGSNDAVTVQFGSSPTNNPSAVYARRLAHSNVVLVSDSLVDTLRATHDEVREKRLLTADPRAIDEVRIQGDSSMTIRRVEGGQWQAQTPEEMPVDEDLMKFFLRLVRALEGRVERDVATDLAAYGLAAPGLRYTFLSASTNANRQGTNRVLAELAFGRQQEGQVFVRRTDEQTVYAIDLAAYEQLPRQAWQLRDLRVWSFQTNELRQVTLQMPGRQVVLRREGPADWALAGGSEGVINDLAVEETMYRLGRLRAEFWVARGEENLARFGFRDEGYRITVEVERDGQSETYEVAFGDTNADQFTYAATRVDGELLVYEFPKKLHFELVRDLMLPFMNRPPGSRQ